MPFQGLILAAGRGSRMKGLTQDIPKGMLKARGKPLIAWLLDAFRQAGIEPVGVVTGYREEMIHFPSLQNKFHNAEWSETNMVYSLLKASAWMKGQSTIISYSDILFSPKTLSLLMQAPGDIVISNNVLWRETWARRFKNPLEDAETFKRDEQGCLTEIGQRPRDFEDIQGQYMGLIKVTPTGWNQMTEFLSTLPFERLRKIDMTSTLNLMIQNRIKIHTVDVAEEWFEFDSEDDLKLLE